MVGSLAYDSATAEMMTLKAFSMSSLSRALSMPANPMHGFSIASQPMAMRQAPLERERISILTSRGAVSHSGMASQ